jgi:fatty acid desaturase
MNATLEKEDVLEMHKPHWVSRAAFPVLMLVFLLSQACVAAALYRDHIWLAACLALGVSHLMHGLLISFHEAAHGLLQRNRRWNEIEGVVLGTLSFMSFSLYRAAHQSHHAHLATVRDEELWPFVITKTPRWRRILAAFLELNVGIFYTPFLFLRTFWRAGSPIRNTRLRRRIWAELVLMVVFWSCLLGVVAWFGAWKYLIWMYMVPAYVGGNLQSWRKYIEHVGLTGSTVISSTRSIVSEGLMGRFVSFTLLHEPYHGVHHRDPGLPHAELPAHVLKLQPRNPGETGPFLSYRHALIHLVRGLADPRVGAQWRVAPSSDPGMQRAA